MHHANGVWVCGALRCVVWMSLAGAGCSETEERHVPRVRREPLAEIVSFDCGSSIPEKRGELVRAMQLGGPGGAAWNWDAGDLVCAVRVSLRCKADLRVTVGAGDHEQLAQVSFSSAEMVFARVDFAPAVWHAQLRRDEQPFATLHLRARVEGSCTEGEKEDWPISVHDAFDTGFASGE